MAHWSLDDIPWHAFDASKVKPEHLSLVKAACMVEHNGNDYARYLCQVFHDDEEFKSTATTWALEEVQHGEALAKYAQLADPNFDFDASFSSFTDGYKLPTDVSESVRGSRCGELIARCVVETGTSTYYTAIKEQTDEPVLKAICAKIAADEFRHYQLFYGFLKKYQEKDAIGPMKRLGIALKRVVESEDDELAFAFFSSHLTDKAKGDYNREAFANRYFACVSKLYDRSHIERMTAMILKAVGIKPHGRFNRFLNFISWNMFKLRTKKSGAYLPQTA
jgi:rubrerythrin